jgi:uncharacterized protein YjgD (DUF1641 family)
MTNEEKILAHLEELTEELRETKRAIRPYVELKQEMEPLIHDMVLSAISRLGGLDKRFNVEALGEMLGQFLVSPNSITEGLRMLNRFMEFKKDFEPFTKDIFHETVVFLQETTKGFDPETLGQLLKEFINNIGNLAEALRMLGSLMDFKRDASTLSKLAFDDIVGRLESLKQKGVFSAFEQVLDVTERMGTRLQSVDLSRAQPVRGVFGMMAALRRPEVQEGLGVLVELATVMTALKEPRRKNNSNQQ